MILASYHDDFRSGQIMDCSAGTFAGSTCTFKTMRSIFTSASGHIRQPSYDEEEKKRCRYVQ